MPDPDRRAAPAEQRTGPAPERGQEPTRARRILRRTVVGTLLVAALVGLLVLSARSASGAPVLWSSAVILAVSVFELDRMGGFRGQGLGLALAPSALLALALVHDSVSAALSSGGAGSAPDLRLLGVEGLCAALLAVTVDLVVRLVRRGGPLAVAGVVTAACYLGLAAWHFGLSDGLDREGRRLLAWFLALPAVWAMLDAVGKAEDRQRFTRAGASSLWIVTPLSALSYVWLWHGTQGLCALLALSKVGDVAGYYFGSLLGRHHPFPRISPGKTTAGCVASLLAATALGGVLVASGVLPRGPLGIAGGLAFGLAVNLAAQAGDLAESACKRAAGVKDAGAWFGPSGGMLDLVDSLLFSVPAGLLAWSVLFP